MLLLAAVLLGRSQQLFTAKSATSTPECTRVQAALPTNVQLLASCFSCHCPAASVELLGCFDLLQLRVVGQRFATPTTGLPYLPAPRGRMRHKDSEIAAPVATVAAGGLAIAAAAAQQQQQQEQQQLSPCVAGRCQLYSRLPAHSATPSSGCSGCRSLCKKLLSK